MGSLVAVIPASPPLGSVAATGTLVASTISQDNIVAGGETLILTLTGVEWVADGATFNAQRQNIIDGIDSNLAETNGWDAERSNIAVTDVVRDSNTKVTITLPALSSYVITTPEILTTTVPTSATTDVVPLIAPQAATLTQLYVLVASGSITTTSTNQIIEKKHITVDGTDGVIAAHNGGTLKDCWIEHKNAHGVNLSGFNGWTVQDCKITRTDAPATGALAAEENGIDADNSDDITVRRIYTEDNTRGFLANNTSNNVDVQFHESKNQRGPFPGGQALQYFACQGTLIYKYFNAYNDPLVSWPEDVINIGSCTLGSPTLEIATGLIDGCNAPSGFAVLLENNVFSVGGTVTDVDTTHQGNGNFSAWNTDDITFDNCNSKDNDIGPYQSRGCPSGSNGCTTASVVYGIRQASTGIEILNSAYQNVENPASNTKVYIAEASVVDVNNLVSGTVTLQTGYTFVPTWQI